MDKAPDAFRTISEVADELDIPQHVLRFWETRFAQIKPMKRSGGRRYYRPDDVDLLKGIRRLLYGEGYTIRGVQRILKEHGIKSVQGIADQTAAISFGAVEEAVGHSMAEADDADLNDGIDLDSEEGDGDEGGIDYRFVDPDEDPILSTYKARAQPAKAADKAPAAAARAGVPAADRERLERVLQDLVACRQMIDAALKDG
ncbi:MerR family transcriptional regulator [Bradyrhizobium sp. CCBAU 51753]|uniref:MerR family transcriptional regulator n=1 Tax=Bradyrhizobium sp. CCBAU 51753 TaxID=1325100 RepID=UPI00188CD5D5|nr:MerR family transcriptional regulator [Bradyrhizobium sp. CCBAU 51753]QOZ26259.1 MerR family transcriptional regulator [Bradyrhizobium sp. CCBAU 51753]